MAWTSPRTWVAGEVLSAALLNTHVRDNLLELNSTASAWTTYTPAIGGVSGTVSLARYKQIGKTVHCTVTIAITSTVASPIGIGLPVAAPAAAATAAVVIGSAAAADTSAALNVSGIALLGNTTTANFYGSTGVWTVTAPFTWASGDFLRFNLTYEAA